MATDFAVDLGGIATPANIESPIVNDSASKAVSGLGTAAHLKFANDNEDAALRLRSDRSGSSGLTEEELKAIQYPQLQAALDQGVLSQDEFQTRLDTNLRRVYAAFPGRSKAYSSFASSVRATLTPERAPGPPQTEDEAIRRGTLEGIQKAASERAALASQLGTSPQAIDSLVAERTRRSMEIDLFNYQKAQGGMVGEQMQQQGFKVLPAWSVDSLTYVTGEAAKNGGSLPPSQIGLIQARAQAMLDDKWADFSSNLPPGSDVEALRRAFDQRREGLGLFIKQMSADNITSGEKSVAVDALSLLGTELLTTTYMINQAEGQEGVKSYYNMITNPNYRDQILKNNPRLQNFISSTGASPDQAWNSIAVKLGRKTSPVPLTTDEKEIVGQAGVNSIAGPAFNGSKDEVLVPEVTKMVEAGDTRPVKAWFTPNGKVKLKAPGEVGDFYREQFKRSMDSVVASTVTELASSTGEIRLSPSGLGFEFVPSGTKGEALHALGQVVGLGSTEIDRKVDLLSKYAEQHPNMVLGGSGSAAEARAQLLEDINKRVERVKAGRVGDTRAPVPTPTTGFTPPSGDVINIDDNGDPIQ